ncbi:hypothetical protein [Marinagarivorans algicola]|uniref:hypothetical protein n=1 Tax=Marinagarivorans algicola TaxID=1513270 RepID=UPI003734E07A
MTIELVIGQNTPIDASFAYQLSLEAEGWAIGALVKKSGVYTSLNNEAGVNLVKQSLYLNLQDAHSTLEEILIYCEQGPAAKPLIHATLITSLTGEQVIACSSGNIDTQLQVLEAIHIYFKNGQWKIKSFFQGYSGGKQALFQAKSLTQHTPFATATSAPLNTPTPPTPGVPISAKLTWSASCAEHFDTSSAYLGSEFSALSSLNFFCLYILKSGQRGVIYGADEHTQGSLEGIPYCKTLTNADKGESELLFNSAYSHKMFKYIICAEITEGSRCWKDTQVQLAIHLDNQLTHCNIDSALHTPFYVLGSIEIIGTQATLKRIDQYFHSPADIASAVGFSRA